MELGESNQREMTLACPCAFPRRPRDCTSRWERPGPCALAVEQKALTPTGCVLYELCITATMKASERGCPMGCVQTGLSRSTAVQWLEACMRTQTWFAAFVLGLLGLTPRALAQLTFEGLAQYEQ